MRPASAKRRLVSSRAEVMALTSDYRIAQPPAGLAEPHWSHADAPEEERWRENWAGYPA